MSKAKDVVWGLGGWVITILVIAAFLAVLAGAGALVGALDHSSSPDGCAGAPADPFGTTGC